MIRVIVSYSRPLRTGMAGIPVLPAKAIPIPVLPIPALPGGGKKTEIRPKAAIFEKCVISKYHSSFELIEQQSFRETQEHFHGHPGGSSCPRFVQFRVENLPHAAHFVRNILSCSFGIFSMF